MSSPSSADVPPGSLAIHLDLVGGIAGDMFVAALLDAMPHLAAPLFAELAKVQPEGMTAPTLVATKQAGLTAARFGLAPARRKSTVAPANHVSRAYASLRAQLEASTLETTTQREALDLLAALAHAEAHVHGTTVDAVHFHELADWHSLLDVVAAGFIAARLAGATWTASPPPLGGGVVKTAHGLLPVPAPVTAHLLAGYPWRDDGIGGERVTPTGAAILRRLVAPASFDRPRPPGRLLATGIGAGTKVIAGLANVTRALVFAVTAQEHPATVATIEFDVDDMTGEEIALAAERLRAAPGVIDVSFGTRAGKKGRPLSDFRLLVDPAALDEVARACFVETSTLGLRVAEAKRHVLRREAVRVDSLGVKVAQRPGGERTAKAEHDDIRDGESLGMRRRQRADAERQALKDDE
jgi:uncharacterized protein (TIGR00299 family) protein